MLLYRALVNHLLDSSIVDPISPQKKLWSSASSVKWICTPTNFRSRTLYTTCTTRWVVCGEIGSTILLLAIAGCCSAEYLSMSTHWDHLCILCGFFVAIASSPYRQSVNGCRGHFVRGKLCGTHAGMSTGCVTPLKLEIISCVLQVVWASFRRQHWDQIPNP